MKNKVFVSICIVLIVAMSTIVALDYNKERVNAAVQSAKESSAKYYREQVEKQRVEQEKTRLKAECDKAHSYYDSLTLTQQKKLEAPNCYLDVIE